MRKVTDLFVLGSGQFSQDQVEFSIDTVMGKHTRKYSIVCRPRAKFVESHCQAFRLRQPNVVRILRIRRRDRGLTGLRLLASTAKRLGEMSLGGEERQKPKARIICWPYPAAR